MISKQVIDQVAEKLIKTYNPIEIYIFGSYAWGNPREDSDLDLLVIVDEFKDDPWKSQSLGYKVLFDFDFSKDIVIYSKKEFEDRSKNISSLFHKIKEEGVKLYARA